MTQRAAQDQRGGRGVPLGSIEGIELRADWSLLIVFGLISVGLARDVFPGWHPSWSVLLCWEVALAAALLFFVSVLLHELSHALVGRANGVQVRRITLFLFGGMAEIHDEPPTWRAELAMAIVGPLTSLAIGVACVWLVSLTAAGARVTWSDPARAMAALAPLPTLLLWLGPINLVLGLFNLVPGFPLDGGRVLRALLWGASGDLRRATLVAARCGQGFAALLMAAGFAMMMGAPVPLLGSGLLDGVWIASVGWFLNSAALSSVRQLQLRQSLGHVPVRLLMNTQVPRVSPDTPVRAIAKRADVDRPVYAVVAADGALLGLAAPAEPAAIALPTGREQTTVGQIMTPLEQLPQLEPEQDALSALELLGGARQPALPVMRSTELLGVVRREDLLRWLATHPADRAGRAAGVALLAAGLLGSASARAATLVSDLDTGRPELRGGLLVSVLTPERDTRNVDLDLLVPLPSGESPNRSALLPRWQIGATANIDGRTSFAYTGPVWMLDFTRHTFADLSAGGLVHDADLHTSEPGHSVLGCRVLYQAGFDFGYRFDAQTSVLLAFNHGSNGEPALSDCNRNQSLDVLGLRVAWVF